MGSIWDYMKPAESKPEPSEIALRGNALAVSWNDGKQSTTPARTLRQQCPCAACVDEMTHKRTLDPASVPADIRLLEVRPTGNYAVQLAFSDGHETGLYTWPLLRELGGT